MFEVVYKLVLKMTLTLCACVCGLRLEVRELDRPPSGRQVTTLRIKSEFGDHTYILKMHFTDTVGDLRKYLNKERYVDGHTPTRTHTHARGHEYDAYKHCIVYLQWLL